MRINEQCQPLSKYSYIPHSRREIKCNVNRNDMLTLEKSSTQNLFCFVLCKCDDESGMAMWHRRRHHGSLLCVLPALVRPPFCFLWILRFVTLDCGPPPPPPPLLHMSTNGQQFLPLCRCILDAHVIIIILINDLNMLLDCGPPPPPTHVDEWAAIPALVSLYSRRPRHHHSPYQ